MRWGYASLAASGLLFLSSNAFADNTCTAPKTYCGGADGYYASSEDVSRVTAVMDPLLKELRACLDQAGGKHVEPAVAIRWDADGKPVNVKVDAPGYESLPCVAKVSGKASQLQNPHETHIKCYFGCEHPAAPAPPPVVPVPPPPPPTAQQQQPPPPPAEDKPPKPATKYTKVWYGWQTLIVDGINTGVLATGIVTTTKPINVIGGIAFYLGAPIVHWAHGNIGSGFGSLALRLFMPPITALMGGVVGLIVGGSGDHDDPLDAFSDGASGFATGFVVGAVAGVFGCYAIDAFGFGYEKDMVPVDPKTQAKPSFTLRPYANIRGHASSFGLGGTF